MHMPPPDAGGNVSWGSSEGGKYGRAHVSAEVELIHDDIGFLSRYRDSFFLAD